MNTTNQRSAGSLVVSLRRAWRAAIASLAPWLYAAGAIVGAHVPAALAAGDRAALRLVDAGWSDAYGWGIGCDGTIRQVVESPDGGYYVAGIFANCGNIRANNVAHFDPASGVWSALGSDGGNGVNGGVLSIVVFRDELWVYGALTTANVGASGEVRVSRFATWNGTGWAPLEDPDLAGFEAIATLRVWNDLLYIGGYFSFSDDSNNEVTGIAVWNGETLSGIGAGASASLNDVVSIASYNDELYVGGHFSGGVRRWNGAQWSTLGSDGGNGLNASARDLVSWNGSLYATGAFTLANHGSAAGEIPASRIARWDGSQWSALGAGLDNTGVVLAVADNQLVVSGLFTSAGGVAARQLASWDGQQWAAVASDLVIPSFPVAVNSMLETPAGLLVAGEFPYAEANPALAQPITVLHGIGLINDGRWSGWGNTDGDGFYGVVRAFARFQDDLYVGGSFRSIGGQPFNGIARWDGERWRQVGIGNGNGVNGSVFDLQVTPDGLYVGGAFRSINAGGEEITAGGVARWDGSLWHALGEGDQAGLGYPGTVWSLAWAPPFLYVGGTFTAPPAGEFGFAANNIARWDGNAWSVLGTDAINGIAGTVRSMAAVGNDLYVGGNFAGYNAGEFGGSPRGAAVNIARWDGSQWHRLGTNGIGLGTNSSDEGVFAIAAKSGQLYVGGSFLEADVQGPAPFAVRSFVRWDGQRWHKLRDAGLPFTVYDLQFQGDVLLVGGKFSDVETQIGALEPSASIAILENDQWIPSASGLQTRGAAAQVYALLPEADGGLYVGGDFDQAGEQTSVRMAYYRPDAETINHSYIYWNPDEPGWGYNLQHQGDLLYGTWYSYAEDGEVMFLTVEAILQSDGSYAGPVYRVAGTPFAQINGSQAFTAVTESGAATMRFDQAGRLSLKYTLQGATQSKQLERFVFASSAPRCFGTTDSRSEASNYSDLWWNDSEAGWGLTLSHQGDTIFALWYTYGEGGRDQWISASALLRQPDGSYVGALQRPTSGTPLGEILGAPATSFPVPEIGSARLSFSDGENGSFSYTIGEVSQSKAIQRFVVVGPDQPKPLCVQ